MNHRVHATKFRRTAATAVRERTVGLNEPVADLMGHHCGTADKYYKMRRREQTTLEAANYLPQLMRGDQKPGTIEQPILKDEQMKDKKKAPAERLAQQEAASSPQRKKWSKEETDAILEIFAGTNFYFIAFLAVL